MSIWILLKIFSDCCVCFSILGAFPGTFPSSGSLLIPALLCGTGTGFAAYLHEKGKGKLCLIGALLPVCAVWLANGAEKLILLSVVGYTVLVILRRQFTLEYYSYRQYFRRSLMLEGALYLLFCAFSFLEGLAEERTIYPDVTLRYGLVHMIVGVMLQRQLRLGLENQAQGSRGQLAVMLGGTGAVIGGFLVVEPALRQGASALFHAVITAVFSVVMTVIEWISALVDQVEVQYMTEQIQQAKEEKGIPQMGPVFREMIQNAAGGAEEPSKWWVYLVMLLLLIVMVLMLRTMGKRNPTAVTPETMETVILPGDGRRVPRRSNRGKIRHYYREYLRMERKRGLKLQKDYTTQDILDRITEDTNDEGASQLRQLYLLARYRENGDITREQAEAAKAALRRSRGGLAE